MKDLEELKKYILENIDPSWSDLEKTRYVYITAGKFLSKYSEFFLTLDKKLEDSALSTKKLDRIYENKMKKREVFKVICKSAAIIIKNILDELNIKSEIIETVDSKKFKDMKNEIHHYFLCVNLNDYNIFLTPVADLPYIKANMTTKHFGSDIPFMLDGNKYYSKDKEIPHRILLEKELKDIDDKIGYTMPYINISGKEARTYVDKVLKTINNNHNKNELYLTFLEEETEFYNGIFSSDGENKLVLSNKGDINEWLELINYVCKNVGKRVAEITNNNYDYKEKIDTNNFDDWVIYVNSLYNKNDIDSRGVIYKNPNLLINKTESLYYSIIDFTKKDLKEDDYISFRHSFIKKIHEISMHFVDERFLIEPKDKDKYVSNTYINHLFSSFLPYLLNSNEDFVDDFNKREYSEQIEIFKYLIKILFSNLTRKNLIKDNEYFLPVNPIFDRLNLYSIKDRHSNGYAVYVSITDCDEKKENSLYWYKYDFKKNTLERTTLTNISLECSRNGKYEILSNRLKSMIDDLELNGKSRIRH